MVVENAGFRRNLGAGQRFSRLIRVNVADVQDGGATPMTPQAQAPRPRPPGPGPRPRPPGPRPPGPRPQAQAQAPRPMTPQAIEVPSQSFTLSAIHF